MWFIKLCSLSPEKAHSGMFTKEKVLKNVKNISCRNTIKIYDAQFHSFLILKNTKAISLNN